MKNKFNNTTLDKLWSLLPRRYKKRFFLVAAVLFVGAVANVGGIASIMPFMQLLADPQVVENHEIFMRVYQAVGSPELSTFLLATGVMVLIMFVLVNLFMTVMVYVQYMYIQSVAAWFTSRLMRGYLEQPYEFFLGHNGAELSKNVFSEVGQVTNGVLIPGLEVAAKGMIALIIIVFLIAVDPLIALIAIAILGGGYSLIFWVVKHKLTRLGVARVKANRHRFRIAAEAFGGIKQVKLSGREGDYMYRFTPQARTFEKTKAKTHIIGKVPKFILEVMALGGILTIALVLFAVEGSVAGVLPVLSLYAVAGYRLMPALQMLFQSVAKMRSASASVDVLYEDMKNLKVEEDLPSADAESVDFGKNKSMLFEHSISLKNIYFHYPNTDVPVINGLNLKIEKNTTVGFVGSTGCGKTTLIDIILGLLSPQDGSYLVDDTEIEGENNRLWQRRMGYVPQDIYLADDTVTRNVAFGVPEQELDFDAVRRACCIAKINDFIKYELAEGYDTIVGERGIRLSGGQRQRIGIARALYHDPELLILDEATSALDGKTEGAIMDAIHTLSHKKTIVMIAHRLTTLRDCDVIYVMEAGEFVDRGSYDELKRRNDTFRIG